MNAAKSPARAPRLAFVTCAALPELYEDERDLVPALRARGVEADAVVWNDPRADWDAFDAVVIRSTWDYFDHPAEFRAWLARVAASRARVVNSPALIAWNSDKRYLRDLEARGVRIVPTAFCDPGQPASLARVLRERGWDAAVLKPAVSGGAHRTHRVDARGDLAAAQAAMDAILATSAALVQPFFPEIQSEGEWSIFFVDGAFTHAVVKRPAPHDYRVQAQHGGTFTPVTPEPALLAEARAVLDAAPERPAYARIDGLRRGGEFYLMEAELIEPYLFLVGSPAARDAYVRMVERIAREAASA